MPPGQKPVPKPKDIFGALFGSNSKATPTPAPKAAPRAPINSSYMDPKWQNPTAKFDPATKNIVQAPSDDPLNWRAIADKQLGLSNNLGGGGGGTAAPAPVAATPALPFPDPRNDINPLYDAARDRMGKLNTELGGEYEKAIAAVKANYGKADADIYGQYQNSRTALDAEANAMGVDPNQMYKGYDQDLRRLEENSNVQQNADLAFFEKMKTLRGQQFTDMQASLEQQRAKALADQNAQWIEAISAMQQNAAGGGGSGGGSGGRGGGGGSSSGSNSITETATTTEDLANVGDIDQLNYLLETDPAAAAQYLAAAYMTSPNPLVKQLGTKADEVAKLNPRVTAKPTTAVNPFIKKIQEMQNKGAAGAGTAVGTANKNKQQQAVQNAIMAALPTSGLFGNPTQKAKITTTGKRKTS